MRVWALWCRFLRLARSCESACFARLCDLGATLGAGRLALSDGRSAVGAAVWLPPGEVPHRCGDQEREGQLRQLALGLDGSVRGAGAGLGLGGGGHGLNYSQVLAAAGVQVKRSSAMASPAAPQRARTAMSLETIPLPVAVGSKAWCRPAARCWTGKNFATSRSQVGR